MLSLWAARKLPEIDSEQRWLVRPRDRKECKRLRSHHEADIFDITIGEVSSNGRYFKLKDYSYMREAWHEVGEFEWLDQLL